MKIKNLGIALVAAVMMMIPSTQAATLDIGLFSTGNFTVDAGSTYQPTQSAFGLTTNTTVIAGDNFYGEFSSAKDLTNYGFVRDSNNMYTNNQLGLEISVTSQAAPFFFTVTLFDSAFTQIQAYTGNTAGLTATPTFVALTPQVGSNDVGGLITQAQYLQFGWDGAGAVNATVSKLQANVIPEPSSASLLALGVAGLVALRARRKS